MSLRTKQWRSRQRYSWDNSGGEKMETMKQKADSSVWPEQTSEWRHTLRTSVSLFKVTHWHRRPWLYLSIHTVRSIFFLSLPPYGQPSSFTVWQWPGIAHTLGCSPYILLSNGSYWRVTHHWMMLIRWKLLFVELVYTLIRAPTSWPWHISF